MSGNIQSSNNTDYTVVTFDEIKQSLINRAKTAYPDTYRDFSRSSFGSMMFDMISLVGEQLNFYAHFVANERLASGARLNSSLEAFAEEEGIGVYRSTVSVGTVTVTAPLIANANFTAASPDADWELSPGTLFRTDAGQTVELATPLQFHADKVEVIPDSLSRDGSSPAFLLGRATGFAKLGDIKTVEVEIGKLPKNHFTKVRIPDDHLSEVISCINSEGLSFSEVPNLLIDTKQIEVKDPQTGIITYQDRIVQRRFQVVKERENYYLLFGYGSEENLSISSAMSNSLLTPLAGVRNLRGNAFRESEDSHPGMYSQSESLGVAPQNTVLTIVYRSNPPGSSNTAAGTVNNVLAPVIDFVDPSSMTEEQMNFVRNNISCTNDTPFNGSVSYTSTREIAQLISAAKGSQARAVTLSDVEAQIRVMPTSLGQVAKVSAVRDIEDLRRTIKVYVLSQNSSGLLEKSSDALKHNVRTYLNRVKMINDNYEIIDANILNIGIDLDLKLDPSSDKNSALSAIRELLFEKMSLDLPRIGENISIGKIIQKINQIVTPKVESVKAVKIIIKTGEGYSDTTYNIASNTLSDGSEIYLPQNMIWELKSSGDITGKIS